MCIFVLISRIFQVNLTVEQDVVLYFCVQLQVVAGSCADDAGLP